MAPEIRPVRADELGAFLSVLEAAAGRLPGEDSSGGEPADDRVRYDLDRTLAAVDGNRIVGGTGSEPVELTVPGPAMVAAAKVTLTGLLPGLRQRGIASALMRRQLPDLRERGEPLAVLMTAQSGVPARHGFDTATWAMALELALQAGRPAPGERPDDVTARLVDRAEAEHVLASVFDRHRRRQVGQVSRSPVFWRGWFADPPRLRLAPGGRFFVLAEAPNSGATTPAAERDTADGVEGYLTYRLTAGPLREQPVQELVIEDLVAVSDRARRALWAFCLDFGQVPRATAWNVPVDEPALWAIGDVRAVRITGLRPMLRLRLVDVVTALAARRYGVPGGELVLDIADPVLAANAGRYRLAAGPDGADCTRTTAAPDLSLSVAELAAAYLGGTDLTTLARAGRVDERRPGALARADAMFAWRPGPWTVTDW